MAYVRRPRLRPVETIVVPDPRHGKVLLLRDSQGIARGQAELPPALVAVVARFDGKHTCREIARAVSLEAGGHLPVSVVEQLADELDRGLFLEGTTFERAKAEAEKAFERATVRPASHAGGAYDDDPHALVRYLEDECLSRASRHPGSVTPHGALVGLVAPHIDPWRGAANYGHAYGALRARLPETVDTFIVFGTSHAPMRQPFAFCRKAFATPLGLLAVDEAGLDELAEGAAFDPYADQMNHKREHSIEFQAVFLRHLLGTREAKILPILAGLGEQQVNATDPAGSKVIERFFEAVGAFVEARKGRVVVVAGADLAHVGPRFGDRVAYSDRERRDLEATDRASLSLAAGLDASRFFDHVVGDLATRRVCGLGPVYSLLRALPGTARGHLLAYEQTVDPSEGSIVSHASMTFEVA